MIASFKDFSMNLAAGLHDSGKIKDRRDFKHGKKSAEIAKVYLQSNINSISEEDINKRLS